MRQTLWLLLILVIAVSCGDGDSVQSDRQSALLTSLRPAGTPRVLVIGFDGGTWQMFDPAIKQGKMPVLSSLLERGVRAPLRTIQPTITPIIWTTIATGKMPSEHGVQAVVDRDPDTGEMRPLTADSVKVRTLWEILTQQNKDVSVVRWPVTWPATEVSGELVTDFAFQTSRTRRVWPESLDSLVQARQDFSKLKDIESLTLVNEAIYNQLDPVWQWKLLVLLREYVLDVQFKNIARTLFEQNQRDFMAVYFYSLDALGHNYYRFLDSENESGAVDFHELVMNWCWLYDSFLAEILDAVDPETYVLICSDHGMDMALEPQNFLIRAENAPPPAEDDDGKVILPPAPPFSTDPFDVKLQYTAPSGQHVNKPDGIFVLAGPEVKQNSRVNAVKITEIAPTILYLLGQPVADDFSDQPRLDLFTRKFVETQPLATISSYESGDRQVRHSVNETYSQEDDLLLNRLEALGYIKQ